MRLGKKKRPPVKARDPHPDARVEAELQQIITIRRTIARKEKQASDIAKYAARAARQSARVSFHGADACAEYARRADELRTAQQAIETEIAALHDDIARRVAALSDDELLFLDP